MSLVRIAARIAAVQALKGKTLVGDNVLDSEIGALDVDADGNLRSTKDKPFISVYTDGAQAKDAGNDLRAMLPNGRTELLFESGITVAMSERNPETGVITVLGEATPGTDAGLEFHLDIVARQIGDALTDPTNDWAEIFRRLVTDIESVERARTSGDERGVRLAAQQIKVIAKLIVDPIRGTELKDTHPLAAFFAKAATLNDPVVTAQVALMQAQLAGAEFIWQTDLRRYGLTRDEGDAMLLTTPDGAEEDIEIVDINTAPAIPASEDEEE